MLDASQNRLNPDGLVTSTLPEFVDSRRQASPADAQNAPSPTGVIRLTGRADSKVDVRLQMNGGKFLACWPKAQMRSSQLLWRDLTLSDSPGTSILQAVSPAHWFTSLRETESDDLTPTEGSAEKFLLFDVDMPYVCPVKVTRGEDHSIVVKNVSNTTLRNLSFYQPENRMWRRTTLGDMAPVKTEQKATTQPAATQPATMTAGATRPSVAAATMQATTEPSVTTQPATTSPAVAVAPQLIQSAPAPAADLAADWTPALKQAAVSDGDCKVIAKIIASEAFDARRLTVVYLMADAEYDQLLPLEVVPEPGKIARLGIVIIKNADPAMGSEMDDLIVQLGDPAWSKREEAYNALLKLGAAAIPKLQQASKNKDLEIVWRAEKLVAALRKGPPQQ